MATTGIWERTLNDCSSKIRNRYFHNYTESEAQQDQELKEFIDCCAEVKYMCELRDYDWTRLGSGPGGGPSSFPQQRFQAWWDIWALQRVTPRSRPSPPQISELPHRVGMRLSRAARFKSNAVLIDTHDASGSSVPSLLKWNGNQRF